MEFHIGEHWIVNFFGLNVHMDTLITLWASMAIILFFAYLATNKTSLIPSKLQAVFENIVLIFSSQLKGLGKEAKNHTPILIALFLLIITGNLIGQVPFKVLKLFPWVHLPSSAELASPTNDLNVTAALAIIVLLYYILSGVKSKGISYFKHYFTPVWFMTPFNILEDFVRPLTLALRLFANILAGEILIMVLGGLIASLISPEAINIWCQSHLNWLPSSFVYNISLFLGSLLPLPVMFFEIFVAFIQALVFTLLTSAYIQGAVGHE